jgi:hypothetical protein
MTSGRRIECVVLAALLSLACLPAAAQWDAAALLASLARSGPERIAYSETRRLAYLDAPLTSRGELEFRPPDWLRRSVQGSGDSYVISDDQLHITSGGGDRIVMLDVHPGLRAFAESLRATLAGDLARLQRFFQLELHGDESNWRLLLRPRDSEVAALIQSIELSGVQARLQRIETREAGGDVTVTELQAAP